MKQPVTIAVSAMLAFCLIISLSVVNIAHAGSGCQTLSPQTLAKKANPYAKLIKKAAKQHGVNPSLVKAVITIESCFRQSARGTSGEKGLMQLMPATALRLNITNRHSTWQNIHGGTRYLSLLMDRYQGNTQRAIAAYNAGEGNIKRNGGIPNRSYVNKVLHAFSKFEGQPDTVALNEEPVRRSKTKRLRTEPLQTISDNTTNNQHTVLKKSKKSRLKAAAKLIATSKPISKLTLAAYRPVKNSPLPWHDLPVKE